MMIYCGVDFNASQHSFCYCNPAGGEIHYLESYHESDDLRGFYSRVSGEVFAGLGPAATAHASSNSRRMARQTPPRFVARPGGRRTDSAMPS